MPTVPNAAEIRLAVAHQPSVGQGVTALLRAFVSAAHEAVNLANPARLKDMLTSLQADMKSWHDAVLANTPLAPETATMPALMPTAIGVENAFADPSPLTLQQQVVTAAVARQAGADEAAQKQAQAAEAQHGEDAQALAERDQAAREQAAAEMAAAKEQSQRDQASADMRSGHVGTATDKL